MSRITDLAAAVVVSARHCDELRLREMPRPVPLDCAASPGGPASPRTAPPATGRGDAR